MLSDARHARFLFVADARRRRRRRRGEATSDPTPAPVLEAALTSLDKVDEWTAAEIEAALRGALVDGLGLKPRNAFGPLRVAVTGRRVSPPLFESMEILGPRAVPRRA